MAANPLKNQTEENQTREQKRENRSKEAKKGSKRRKRFKKRKFPIWLRIIVVAILIAASAILGAMFGYGVLGDGVPSDVLNKGTWQHIVDIVEKKK